MFSNPFVKTLIDWPTKLTFINARREWNQVKISCLVTFGNWAMFSYAMFWSANSFPVDSKPCDYLCLLSLLVWHLFLQPIGATWNFTFVVCLVMVLWVAADGAATKPRASYGCRHMAGCLARAGITVSSHDPLSNDRRCAIFLCSSLVISPYHIEEQVTDINFNRLQYVVVKWLYLVVPVLMNDI
jgi:hypothetical protein